MIPVRVVHLLAFSTFALFPAAALNAAPAAPAAAAASDNLTVCEALTTEMDVLGKRTEGQMIAMGQRLGREAATAVAENKAYNATQPITGRLNWVAPGLGTALDMINKSLMKASQKRRQLTIERERIAATLTTQQAVSRMLELSNELILNDCAEL